MRRRFGTSQMLLRPQWRSLLSAPRLWLVVHGHSLLIVAPIFVFVPYLVVHCFVIFQTLQSS